VKMCLYFYLQINAFNIYDKDKAFKQVARVWQTTDLTGRRQTTLRRN